MTEQELDAVAREVVERWKDIIFVNGYDKVRRKLECLRGATLAEADEIAFEHEITIIYNDIPQIVGRIRRTGGQRRDRVSL